MASLGLCLCARCQESVLTFTSKLLCAHTNGLLQNPFIKLRKKLGGIIEILSIYWLQVQVFLDRTIQQLWMCSV